MNQGPSWHAVRRVLAQVEIVLGTAGVILGLLTLLMWQHAADTPHGGGFIGVGSIFFLILGGCWLAAGFVLRKAGPWGWLSQLLPPALPLLFTFAPQQALNVLMYVGDPIFRTVGR